MKKYLLVVVFLSVSVCAESNPFNLQENLQKIDQDQDILLSALKEMAGDKEIEADDTINEVRPVAEDNIVPHPNETGEDDVKREDVLEVQKSEEEVVTTTDMVEKEAKAKKQELDQLAMQKAEELRFEKVKAEQIKIEQERAQKAEEEVQLAQKLAEEKMAAQKRKEERLEVEAYEAKRLAKDKEEKLALEKKAPEDKVKDTEKIESKIVKEKEKESEHRVVDIDIDNEKRMAKKHADKEYLDAIREVN
jgi:hypothetical protein